MLQTFWAIELIRPPIPILVLYKYRKCIQSLTNFFTPLIPDKVTDSMSLTPIPQSKSRSLKLRKKYESQIRSFPFFGWICTFGYKKNKVFGLVIVKAYFIIFYDSLFTLPVLFFRSITLYSIFLPKRITEKLLIFSPKNL